MQKNIYMKKNIMKNSFIITASFFIVVIFLISFLNMNIQKEASFIPNYSKINLQKILQKEHFTDDDYKTLLMQTGLGENAVDKIIKTNSYNELNNIFNKYQSDFLKKPNHCIRKIGLVTYEDKIINKEGNIIKAFEIPDIKNGDVVISKSTFSLGWRHGHAALVTNAEKGEIIEATVWGCPTKIKNISSWQSYSSFILLRPKKAIESEEISKFALEKLKDIPYGIFTGIPNKDPDCISKTQCAHLVWYCYYKFGYDIDSDGGWLVTPKDIARSKFFDIVQVYGVNPEEIW
ncbi:hypothetical protein [Anaerovorax odorimutans]|uniref:hypothetical protein n=1 Tax=Anaerovorax odorimutans TaxID=109327 RepID=UPI000414D011|nr:hypothetical protein [Anaerovorax odorimutans]